MTLFNRAVALSNGFLLDVQETRAGLFEARFDPAVLDPQMFEAFGLAREPAWNSWAPKRQADFLAGRALAAVALDALGAVDKNVKLGPDRAPVWPTGFAGSISHTAGRCACLVTSQPARLCGIDAEMIASDTALDAILSRCLHSSEIDQLSLLWPVDVGATLLFSAKETLFKALYPIVGDFFGFECAELVAPVAEHVLQFRLTEGLHASLPQNYRVDIHFDLRHDHVLTWASLEQS